MAVRSPVVVREAVDVETPAIVRVAVHVDVVVVVAAPVAAIAGVLETSRRVCVASARAIASLRHWARRLSSSKLMSSFSNSSVQRRELRCSSNRCCSLSLLAVSLLSLLSLLLSSLSSSLSSSLLSSSLLSLSNGSIRAARRLRSAPLAPNATVRDHDHQAFASTSSYRHSSVACARRAVSRSMTQTDLSAESKNTTKQTK